MLYAKNILTKILIILATAILKKHKPFIIAVTGNLGKTTTKDSIVSAISGQLNFIGSKKSLNSEIGIPLTIIGSESGWKSLSKWLKIIYKGVRVYLRKDYVEYLVLEVGADAPNDIKNITKFLHPNLVVMTQFAEVPVHVENFKNRDELVREKRYLVEALVDGGTLIYNSDCLDSKNIAETLENKTIKKLSFGLKDADIIAKSISSSVINKKVTAKILFAKNKVEEEMLQTFIPVECDGVIGESAILCTLPAILIVDELGLDMDESLENIKNMSRAPGRMRVLDGINKSIIIDDSYNSSPLAAQHGAKTVGELKNIGKKIFVIGDMMELGEFTKPEHLKLGKTISKYAHILITVGVRARDVAEGAMNNGMGEGWVLECDDAYEAGRELAKLVKAGDIVYVKGSQSMRLERATAQILSEEIKAKEVLPRQESEWLRR